MPHKDRTTGLIIFGILTILLGCCAGLLGSLTLVSQSFVPQDQRVDIGTLLPAFVIYGILGIALFVLGIGSIMARRWARALLLIFSWSWLGLGVIECVALGIIMPQIMTKAIAAQSTSSQSLPPGTAVDIALCVMFFFFAFFFILLPGVWTFFYMSPHVRATCEARDPIPGWTDACPLPVLGLCLWMWFSVPMMLLMPFSGHTVLPLFGALVTGVPADFIFLLFALVWAFGGWLTYRIDIRGWWLVLVSMMLGSISSIITFSTHDMLDIYRVGNYPQAQIDQLQKTGLFTGHSFVWIMVVALLPFLGYLIFVRRYFAARS